MTLLSIVGDDISRIIPVLYAYKKQIKHHVLLCDDEPSNKERAKTLQKGMQKFSAKHSLEWDIRIISTNEDSAKDIKESASKAFDTESELWLNATDGYPAITILLSELVRNEGGKVISYDHFDNDLHIIEADGNMVTKQLDSKIDIDSYITLLNYKIITKKDKKRLSTSRDDVMSLYVNESHFAKVRNAIIHLDMGYISSFDFEPYRKITQSLQNMGIINSTYDLNIGQQSVLQGDLFEEYIFWLCEALDPDDIALGVKIDFDDKQNEPDHKRRVYNEFDILIAHNNRIYTVECKFAKNLDGLDFVYKYDAIIDYFGKASKAIIANISPTEKRKYIGMNASQNFKHSTLRRARMAGVAVYHESQVNVIKFQNLVRNFFHMN